MSDRKRLDVWMVEKGLAASRTLAQEMIAAGQVSLKVGGTSRPLKKTSYDVGESDVIEVSSGAADRYVSRGGLKLEGAFEKLGVRVDGRSALDVGQSTGGFTDCLLKKGARAVVGFDVGHGQLHESLRQDQRVHAFEGVHFRDLLGHQRVLAKLAELDVDLIVMDLAFVSVLQAFPVLSSLPGNGYELVSLVKPQFELSASELTKAGLVKDPSHYPEIQVRVLRGLEDLGWRVLDWIESPITGKDGNKEFFVHAQRD